MSELIEIRRTNLEKIVEAIGLAEAARRFRKPASQIRDMLAKRKSFGEKVARQMEKEWAAGGWPPISLDDEGQRTEEFAARKAGPTVDDSMSRQGRNEKLNSQRLPSEPSNWVRNSANLPKNFDLKARSLHWSQEEKAIFEELPDDLKQYLNRQLRFGSYVARPDYASEKLVVELKLPLHPSIDSGLLQLATYRGMLGPEGRDFVLLLVGDTLSTGELQSAVLRGGLLGISVHVVSSASEAAHLIAKLEREHSPTSA